MTGQGVDSMGYRAVRDAIRHIMPLNAAFGLAGAVLLAAPAAAEGITTLAASCQTCHAGQGAIPAITAMPPDRFITLMQGFRDTPAQATIMARFATGLTDAEIAALAAWFAEQDR